MSRTFRPLIALFASLALFAAACGGDDATTDAAAASDAGGDRPSLVVTTNILGDVVENLVGDQFEVTTIMPVGADPHTFSPSAQQVALISSADVLVTNGAAFEEGLLDVIETAEADGVVTFEAMEFIDSALEFGEEEDEDHDHEGEEEHADEDEDHDHDEDEDHDDEDEDRDRDEDEDHDDEYEDHADEAAAAAPATEEDHDDEDEDHDHEEGEDEHAHAHDGADPHFFTCLLYTSPSPRDATLSRMPSSA